MSDPPTTPPASAARRGRLTALCGKMGAGKSTLARRLANEERAVVLSEDAWLSKLFAEQIASFDDYLKYSARLRPLVEAHVGDLLRVGTDVILDFPANTAKQRRWSKTLADRAGAEHRLIYLRASDGLCLAGLASRRVEQPDRAAFDTEAVFRQVTAFFEAPSPDEGLAIEILDREP